MCPNQAHQRNLLPDCNITNRIMLYEMMHYMHSEELRNDEVDAQLRDRYEIFSQVLHNYPMPVHARADSINIYDYVYDALVLRGRQRQQRHQLQQEQLQRQLELISREHSTAISMENTASESSVSLASITSRLSNMVTNINYYEVALGNEFPHSVRTNDGVQDELSSDEG